MPPPAVIPQVQSRVGVLGAGKVRSRLPLSARCRSCSPADPAALQMSEAMIRGFIASGLFGPEDIMASVRSAERWQAMESLGVQPVGDALRGGAAEIAASCDTIILGVSWHRIHDSVKSSSCLTAPYMVQVKPQVLDHVLTALAPHVTPQHLIISIAAGVQLASIEGALPEGSHVVRLYSRLTLQL